MQSHITEIIESLKKELQKPLPGLKAQHEMVPTSRLNDLAKEPVNPKKGGVLLMIYENAEKLKLVFIQRTDDGGVHSGQISFPGGKFEPGDKDLIATALREAEEEVGIDASRVQILGNLTTMFIPVSNYMVSPTVGFYNGTPEFKPNPDEVAGLLEVTLAHLVDDKTKGPGLVDVRGRKFEVPVFHVEHHKIWGATAMILNEFIQVIKRANGAVKL
ncbi:MAG: CoA pyrophosphatase [Chloroflexia bacterium]|nr:CoA pyrophosphatase [Chloroflexia bacterium]